MNHETNFHKNSGPMWEQMALSAVITRRRLFATVFAITFVSLALVIILLPKRYESQMKLLVKNGRQDVVVSPERNISTIHSNELSEAQVNSEIELIRSVDVLKQVALKSRLAHESGTVIAAGAPSPVALDNAVRSLGKQLDISPVKKSNIIEISYQAKTPELATTVLNRLADTYLEAHLKVHGALGTYSFFAEQAGAYHAALDKAENELGELRNRFTVLIMPDAQAPLMQRAVDAQAALEDVDAQISEYEKRVSQGKKQISEMAPRVTSQIRTVPQTMLVQQLSETITQLKNRRTELLTKFNPEDRLVLEVDNEIAQTTAALEKAARQTSVETQTDLNAIRQDAEKNFETADVMLAGLKARRARLAQVVSAYQDKMHTLAEATIQHDQLVRTVKENEENYLLYSRKKEEARIEQSLDQQRIANVAVVQAPTVPVTPASPRVKLDLVLAAFLAALVAFVTVIVSQTVAPAPMIPSKQACL
jgi:uncharacterized protein involved in exopolysaccharide biosynthesis